MQTGKPYHPPQFFAYEMACMYGLDVAVLISGLDHYISLYAEQKRWSTATPPDVETIVVEGCTYAPFTLDDLHELFPWWSRRQIQLIKAKAIQSGFLHQDYFSANSWDRRLWYAVESR